MSRYVRKWKFDTVFDGDEVSMELKPIEQIDWLIFDWVRGVPRDQIDAQKLSDEIRGILPKYVSGFAGLSDAAGATITLDEVVRDAWFQQLVLKIGLELLAKATPGNPTRPDASLSPQSSGVQ